MIVQLGVGVRARAESPNAWGLEVRESERDRWLNVSYHSTLAGACLRAVERGLALPDETLAITDLVVVLRKATEAIQSACKAVPAPMPIQPESALLRPSSRERRPCRYPERLEDFVAPTEPAPPLEEDPENPEGETEASDAP